MDCWSSAKRRKGTSSACRSLTLSVPSECSLKLSSKLRPPVRVETRTLRSRLWLNQMTARCLSKMLGEQALWKLAGEPPRFSLITGEQPPWRTGFSRLSIYVPPSLPRRPREGYVDIRGVTAVVAGIKLSGRLCLPSIRYWFDRARGVDAKTSLG